jgi:glycosyltransferase involved in cell wall biosynthesis
MPNLNPTVSVIIPAYNAEKFIGDSIRSVLNQTWFNLEVIIVNDGSTDHTADAVQQFLSDKRVRLINQPNAGCSAAKNTGLAAATGDYIQYLDADDILSADKIHEQVTALMRRPFDIAVCRTVVFDTELNDSGNREIDTEFLFTTSNSFEFMLNLYGVNGRQGMIQPNAFLISKKLADAIGKWDVSISPCPDEDGEYFCRAMLKANHIWFTEKGINYYRKQASADSLSKKVSLVHARGGLLSLQIKANHLLLRENSTRVKQLVAKHYAEFIYQYSSQYTALCNEAEREVYKLGLNRIPSVGGRYFKTIASIIGFQNTLSAKRMLKELPLRNSLSLLRKELSLFRMQAK